MLMNVDERDCNGATCLYLACFNNDIEMVKLLLKYNADPNKSNYYGSELPLVISLEHKNYDIVN